MGIPKPHFHCDFPGVLFRLPKEQLCPFHPFLCYIFCKSHFHFLTEYRTEIIGAHIHRTCHFIEGDGIFCIIFFYICLLYTSDAADD